MRTLEERIGDLEEEVARLIGIFLAIDSAIKLAAGEGAASNEAKVGEADDDG